MLGTLVSVASVNAGLEEHKPAIQRFGVSGVKEEHVTLPPERVVMERAADDSEAAVRFLHAIGYEEFVPIVQRLDLSLMMLTSMTMLDLERRLGVSPKKAVVALFDECLKLRRCLNRSSTAVDVPHWLPMVLRVPPELINPTARGSNSQRPSSARGASIGPGRPQASGARSARSPRRPMSAGQKVRVMLSGIKPPINYGDREVVREQRMQAQKQLAEHLSSVPTPHPPVGTKPQKAPRRVADADAAAAAKSAKAAVMHLVGEREAAVGALRTLMPAPRGLVARKRATQQLIVAAGPLAEARADLTVLLSEVRRTSAAICAAIYEWKLVLRARYAYFASLGEKQMAFYVGGVNYLTKMSTDLRFLPAPSQQDPLLLHWFGHQVPWILKFDPTCAEVCLPEEHVATFQPKGVVEGESPAQLALLATAQKELLEEAARNGTLLAPAKLVQHAVPPPASADDDGHLDGGARWQWAALQTLLYGSECYRPLVGRFPMWFKNRELEEAAVVVQQQYRNRLTRRFARTRRAAAEQKKVQDANAARLRLWRAAARLQRQFRGFVVRRAIREAASEQRSSVARQRSEHEQEIANRKILHDQRAQEDRAAFCIQNRFKVLQAKKKAKAKKADANLETSNASNLLAQTRGVTLLEKVLTRHRASNAVMWETYSIVCLPYEVAALESTETEMRKTHFYSALQHRLAEAEAEQYESETQMRAKMIRDAERELAQISVGAKGGGGGTAAAGSGSAAAGAEQAKAKQGKALGMFAAKADITKADTASELLSNVAHQNRPISPKKSSNALKGQATLEEQAAAAARLGPDGKPRIHMLRMYNEAIAASKEAHLKIERLSTEVHIWQAEQKMRAADVYPDAKLRNLKVERGEQAIQAQRDARAAEEASAQVEAAAGFQMLIDSGGEREILPLPLLTSLLDGAEAELKGTSEWAIPNPMVNGQRAFWADVRKQVVEASNKAKDAQEDALRVAKESMKRDGAAAPITELCRLVDRMERVKSAAAFLVAEMADSKGASMKMRERAQKLEQDAEPPMPAAPLNPNDTEGWKAYVDDVNARAAAFEASVTSAHTLRAAQAEKELDETRERAADLDLALHETRVVARAWVLAEGRLRVLTSLQSPERGRLNRILLGKRSEAYRKMCAEPVDTKLKYKAATRELSVVSEAESLAEAIESSDVQHRVYQEGYVTIRVLDGREAPLAELIGNAEAQANVANNLVIFLGCVRDDRLYVHSAKRVEIMTSTSMGDVLEPGTELQVNVKREIGTERTTLLILQGFMSMHEMGQLGEVLGVNRDNIRCCEVKLAKEVVREAPTLVQLKSEAEEQRAFAQKRYDASVEVKAQHKAQLRTWHRLKGALLHLRQLDASKVVAAAKQKHHADGEGKEVEVVQDGQNAPQFLHRWMGVRDILKSKLSVLAAISERDVRARMKDELVRTEGRLRVLDALQEGCMTWPMVTVTLQGNECVPVDRRWNQGLAKTEFTMENAREPSGVEEERKCGRFCYFCASLEPQIRVQHRMVDCPKRKKANAREYLPEAMAGARSMLAEQREVCEAQLAEHTAATVAVKMQKQALLELAGAIKVLGAQEGHKPPPEPPPPPPTGERHRTWKAFVRRRIHQQTMVMKSIARGSRSTSSFSNVPGSWAELKAVALMMPNPRVLDAPLDPTYLFECAKFLHVDIAANGDDHLLLPFVIALARAPLPPHWEPLNPLTITKEDIMRYPKWFDPPPSDDVIYGSAKTAAAAAEAQAAANAAMAPESAEPWSAPADAPAAAPVVPTIDELLRHRGGRLDVYENVLTRKREHGHPGAPLIVPLVRGMQVRAARTLKPAPTDGWVQFVDAADEPYFYNFCTRERVASFPVLKRGDVARCVLPARTLEPSAMLLCSVGQSLLPANLAYKDAIAEARRLLYEPRKAARAVQLASAPETIDEHLCCAQFLGIAPVDDCDMMFLVECMLAPELPCGWLARASPGMTEGGEYYWNMMTGAAQWEHPQISLLMGVAIDLKKRMRDAPAAAEPEKANTTKGPRRVSHRG